MIKKYALIIGLMCIAPALYAQEVKDIQVRGVRYIEPATVISYLPFQQGDTITEAQRNEGLKALLKTGRFDAGTKITQKGGVVTIDVQERPVVTDISFEGNDKLETEMLEKELRLKVRDAYTPTKLQKDVDRLKAIYQRMGMYSVEIQPQVNKLSDNRVEIVFQIDEGKKNYIEDIEFVGNDAFSTSTLQEALMSRTKRWWRFFTSTDTYDPDRIDYDKELLTRFYVKRGYIDFEIVNTQVRQDPETKDFSVLFTIKEGQRYRFGAAKVKSKLARVDQEELQSQVAFSMGRYYSADLVEESVQDMTEALGREGFAFVDIDVDLKRHPGEAVVDVYFNIKESPRIFVNRVDISGNSRTLDKVIRRELRFVEGDPFNTEKLRRSKQRIENLNYFSKVDMKPVQVANARDKADVQIDVAEKSTGAFNIGVGWSTYDGALFEAGVQERNFLGTGNIVGVSGSVSKKSNEIDLSFTDPYFMDLPMSAGIDLFRLSRDYTDDSSYEWHTIGASLRTGWDYTEHLRQTVRYTLQRDEVTNVEQDASPYIKEQEGKTVVSMIGESLVYDRRDSAIDPTEGYVTSLGLDFAGLGGDAKFVRANVSATQYFELMEKVVLSLNGTGGYIVGVAGQDVRIDNRYFLGGYTLRGFASSGVGARDKYTDDALGGDWRVTATAQLTFPVGLPQEFGVRGKLFIDAGMLGKPSGSYDWNRIDYSSTPRVAVGTGLLWQSPMGPINIDFGFPIRKEPYDKKEVFRLNFGTSF
ncbi:MAG: outer membrane protein assembly factor BamA [Alphaproteobacteria bacterium]|nr:outer membrane protein assembly factor BamA [Alphaproteobacteria bacterium]